MIFMIRKLTLFLLTACMLLALAACGGNAEDGGDSQSDSEGLQSAQSHGTSGQGDDDASDGGLQPIALQGGIDLESAEAVPLDARLAGKTAQNESQWYSFTTDTTENATYKIMAVNQTPETSDLCVRVYDESGETIHDPYGSPLKAGQRGKAATLSLNLPPETTYYIKIWADKGDVIDYVLTVRSPEGQLPENNTAQPGPEPANGLEIPAATNQDDAQLIPLNAKLEGKVSRDKAQWYAFSTNSAENATYNLTTVNMTRGTGDLDLRVYDIYGDTLHDPYGAPLQAAQKGQASTLSLDLPPETTYYICIWADKGDTIEYTLNIQAPDDPAAQG